MFEKIIIFLLVSILAFVLVFFNIKIENSSQMGQIFRKGKKEEKKEENRIWKHYQLGKEKEYGNGKKRSVGEQKCLEAAEKIFGEKFYTVRPDWLKNPATGKNLEIDIYSSKLGLGIEFDGYQHYVYPNKFHKTKEEFLKQVERDKFKDSVCEEKGVYLIRVIYDCKDIEQFIYEKAPKDCICKSYLLKKNKKK